MNPHLAQAAAVEKICRHHAEHAGVRLLGFDGHAVLRDDKSDSFRVTFEKDGLFTGVLLPVSAGLVEIESKASGIAKELARHVANYHADRYEPEIMGPTERAWRADRACWLAKREGRPAPFTADELIELHRERVVSYDLATGETEAA